MVHSSSIALPLRLGIVGAGFWSRFQIAAWRELPQVHIAAICDADVTAAGRCAAEFSIPAFYGDARQMLSAEQLDCLDIVTGADSHAALVSLGSRHGLPVVCQKPMAPDFSTCVRMVKECEQNGTLLFIHENYRWQSPMRAIAAILASQEIGRPFRAHIQLSHGPVELFQNQPYLFDRPHFALEDMGPHLLDLARFFFGEPQEIYASAFHVKPEFRGEDVVSIFLKYFNLQCHCELTWCAEPHEVFIEGERGTLSWDGKTLKVITPSSTSATEFSPLPYPWADSAYGFAHSSIVETNRHLMGALLRLNRAETSGRDNLHTMQLLDLAAQSIACGQALPVVRLTAS